MVWPSRVAVTVGLGSLSSVTDATMAEGTTWSPVSPVKDGCLRVIFGAMVSGGTEGSQPVSEAVRAIVTTAADKAAENDATTDAAKDFAKTTLARYPAQ